MRALTTSARILGGLWIALVVFPKLADAQSIGYGASPGRAAYRPNSQWNNGPYYTAPHVDPYAPHPAVWTGLYAQQALVPPWTRTGPHGLYTWFYPGNGTLYPYVEGFSPYSGFAPWYARTYEIVPNREVAQGARDAFFRSAPYPPAEYLPALPPQGNPVQVQGSALATSTEPPMNKIVRPTGGPEPLPRPTIRIYRSSVGNR